jgi:hypothetical protein
MTDIHISPEALEKAAMAVHDIDRRIVGEDDWPTWEALSPTDKQRRLHRARAACLAMLKAWPGAEWLYVSEPVLALPMPTENTSAES